MSDNSDKKMETTPVGRLMFQMSLPMMVSFFIQALYNIVDSIFVSRISEDALTAVSLSYPMQMICHAIAVGIGVGINASIPKYLGQGNRDRADRTAANALIMDLFFWVLFLILGFSAVRAIFYVQTDDAEILSDGITYLTICWVVSCGQFFGEFFEKLLVACGKPTRAMLSMASGAVFNIIFDPLLIFGVGPFPEMGIAGAAWATVLGQCLAAVVALIMNLRQNREIRVKASMFRPDFPIIREVFSVGFPSMITIGLTSVSGFSINQILLSYSTTATSVYGIWIKLQNFCYMPLFGMNNGMVPILSYNHARERNDRVRETMRIGKKTALFLMLGVTAVLECIPRQLLSLFDASEYMMSIGVIALRLCILSLPFGGQCIIRTTAMQALEHSRYTLFVNIMRQMVVIICLFALFSALTHNLNMVWAAVPVTEIVSFLIALYFEKRMRRQMGF